jgi:hypothetical protein
MGVPVNAALVKYCTVVPESGVTLAEFKLKVPFPLESAHEVKDAFVVCKTSVLMMILKYSKLAGLPFPSM